MVFYVLSELNLDASHNKKKTIVICMTETLECVVCHLFRFSISYSSALIAGCASKTRGSKVSDTGTLAFFFSSATMTQNREIIFDINYYNNNISDASGYFKGEYRHSRKCNMFLLYPKQSMICLFVPLFSLYAVLGLYSRSA